MTRIIRIDCCGECPYFIKDDYDDSQRCELCIGLEIPKGTEELEVPEGCQLPKENRQGKDPMVLSWYGF